MNRTTFARTFCFALAMAFVAGGCDRHAESATKNDRAELERINTDLAVAELDVLRWRQRADSLMAANARRLMDSMNVANKWHFNRRTVDSLAVEWGEAPISPHDKTGIGPAYLGTLDSMRKAQTTLELAQRKKNQFMSGK